MLSANSKARTVKLQLAAMAEEQAEDWGEEWAEEGAGTKIVTPFAEDPRYPQSSTLDTALNELIDVRLLPA